MKLRRLLYSTTTMPLNEKKIAKIFFLFSFTLTHFICLVESVIKMFYITNGIEHFHFERNFLRFSLFRGLRE